MHEVIQSVIATEAEANEIVATARTEANRIANEARQKRVNLVARVQAEARAEAERIVATAVEQAERELREGRERVAAELDIQLQIPPDIRESVIVAAMRCVCGESQK